MSFDKINPQQLQTNVSRICLIHSVHIAYHFCQTIMGDRHRQADDHFPWASILKPDAIYNFTLIFLSDQLVLKQCMQRNNSLAAEMLCPYKEGCGLQCTSEGMKHHSGNGCSFLIPIVTYRIIWCLLTCMLVRVPSIYAAKLQVWTIKKLLLIGLTS